jgi:HAMP domain-containing protein
MSFLDELKLAPKLLSIPLGLCAAMAAGGGLAQYELGLATDRTERLYLYQVKPLGQFAEFTEAVQRTRGLLDQGFDAPGPAAVRALHQAADERWVALGTALTAYGAGVDGAEDESYYAAIRTQLGQYEDAQGRVWAALEAGDRAGAERLRADTCEPLRTTLETAFDDISADDQRQGEAAFTEAQASAATLRAWLVGSTVGAILVGMAASTYLVRDLTRRAQALAGVARHVAAGEPAEVDTRGRDELAEVAQAFHAVVTAQDQLAGAATRVAAGDPTVQVTPRGAPTTPSGTPSCASSPPPRRSPSSWRGSCTPRRAATSPRAATPSGSRGATPRSCAASTACSTPSPPPSPTPPPCSTAWPPATSPPA